jgi:hypothetical protein
MSPSVAFDAGAADNFVERLATEAADAIVCDFAILILYLFGYPTVCENSTC